MRQCWSNAVQRVSTSLRTIESPSLTQVRPELRSSNVVDPWIIKTGFSPATSRSNFLMADLVKRGEISKAQQLYDKMPEKNIVSTNTLISGYVKIGDLSIARRLFDGMVERTNVTWTILIGGYSKYGPSVEAFMLYAAMCRSGSRPDHVTFAALLSGFDDEKMLPQVAQAHGHVVKLGLYSAVIVCNTLVDCYCKCFRLDLALTVCDEMPQRDSVTYNTLISGYSIGRLNEEAISLFMRMQDEGYDASEFTFAAILSAGAGLGDFCFGQQVHGFLIKANFVWNVFVSNALLDFYSKRSQLEDAVKLFNEMPELDGVSYNVIISGLAWEGRYSETLKLFRELQRNDFSRAEFPYPTLLSIAANTSNLEMGRQIHSQCIVTRVDSEIQVRNALVDMYAKCEQFKEANKVFETLAKRGTIPWTAFISAFVQRGHYEESLRMFGEMCKASVEPDQATFASILRAASGLASPDLGKQLHSFLVRSGFMSNVFSGSALVDMYAKCGSLKDASKAFSEMKERNIVTWNALLSAYAQNGDGEGTIKLFEEMISRGLSPDPVSFLNVLTACSHCGLVEEGLKYFDQISNVYDLEPRREHYVSMVDVLCRSGQFERAKKLMHHMPFNPDEVMLSSILNSCKIHKNHELAKEVANQLFSMELSEGGAYVNMSNIYASAGQWDNVAEVKKAMRTRGIKKVPAYSWVEIDHQVHVFSASDQSHPRWKEIVVKIETLSKKMEDEGYQADTSCALHNWDEDMKAESLKYHSERLAIAFALISTSEGVPILVMKNLRACSDCHSAIKMISKIVGREITVRDSSRFHHFIDGHCSCRDYW